MSFLGELAELRKDLSSDITLLRKEAMKKVIAGMTIGKDVSPLFAEVLMCIQTDDLELKKLVYLYLMNYAKTQPELALLAINTFIKVNSLINVPSSNQIIYFIINSGLWGYQSLDQSIGSEDYGMY